MNKDDLFNLRYKYEYGVFSLKDIFNMVKEKKINEEEFHIVTGYNYKGIKKSREWD